MIRDAELRAVFELARDAIFIADNDGRYLDVNPAGAEMLGVAREEIVGRSLADYVPADIDAVAAWESFLARGADSGFVRLRRPDGCEIEAEYSWRARVVPNRHLLMFRDVTERRPLDERRWLTTRMDAVGRLAGGIAHDFNNLLTVIVVSSEMLAEQFSERTLESRLARETLDAAKRAAMLTNQLLAYSGRQLLRPEDVDLNELIGTMETTLRNAAGDRIAVQMNLESSLPLARVDRTQLELVIVNLAMNARDAMPDGGRMIVDTEHALLTDAYSAQHVGVQPGSYVMLAVSDTGSGMDLETKRRVFEPFFTTKAMGHGAGLGLSTAYGIVKQSGGNIWVYSQKGRGTTFKVYLPQAPAAVGHATVEAVAEMSPLPIGRASVLLVDDEAAVRSVATRVLERCGYTVTTASSGEEAIERYAAQHDELDLLITDVVMPGISGGQLVKHLRSRHGTLRVLFTSGYTEEVAIHHGVAEGEHFLAKPFTASDLAQKVRQVLDAPI